MLQEERLQKILMKLENEGIVKISDLIEEFHVTGETIRRDFDILQNDGLITRIHGGAVLVEGVDYASSFVFRKFISSIEKQHIASKVCEHIQEGQTVGLHSSTSNFILAKQLVKSFTNLTLVTDSIPIATELSRNKGFRVLILGGVINPNEGSVDSSIFDTSILDHFSIDVACIAPGGISLRSGITEYIKDELVIEKSLIRSAVTRIVLSESAKFNKNCILKVCDLSDIDMVVTDLTLADDVFKEFADAGVNIVR